MTEEMSARLDDLNVEIKNIGKAITRLRYEDMKLTFSEQMKKALEDYSRQRLGPDITGPTSCANCSMREGCADRFSQVVMEAAEALREDRDEEAIAILDEVERILCSESPPCEDPLCCRNALLVLGKARAAVELFGKMRERFAIPSSVPVSSPRTHPSPHEVAASLSPLAHPKRVEILELLAEGERSFSEIGRAVDLKTGHLQFHLKPLLEIGLIDVKGRGRSYRLTIRGERTMAGVSDLMVCMSSI